MRYVNIQYQDTIIGELILGSFDNKICIIGFKNQKNIENTNNRIQTSLKASFIEKNNNILEKTKTQIDEYLNKTRRVFDIDILTIGSYFQKMVWNSLIKIEYGSTSSYLQLAKDINRDNSFRALANANRANPILIIIPCHRAIRNNGSLGGYSGGLDIKKFLLKLEGNTN